MSSTTGFAPVDPTIVPRVTRVGGRLRVPGDKSISHRYAMLAGIADGTSHLTGYAPGADCAATLACLQALGVTVARAGGVITIEGLGLGGLRAARGPLDAANSGTSMRLLAGLLAPHPFRTIIGGDESLSRRPMRRVIEPLTRMGAAITAVDGRPPLTIDGASLHGISYSPDVPSAQVKSAILLAGLHARGQTSVVEPYPTRDHTERALHAFGVRVTTDGQAVTIEGGQRLHALQAPIPGDISSAVFWLVLAAGTPGSDLVIDGVGLNPSRALVLDVLRRAGAAIEVLPADQVLPADHLRPDSAEASSRPRRSPSGEGGQGYGGQEGGSYETDGGEPIGSIRVRYEDPRPFEIAPAEVPGLIDEIPALAALAAMHPGGRMTVRGAAELRVKESDRITMLARGFGRLGIKVDEYEDGFTIHGGPPAEGEADAAGDHRLAMAFAVAGSRARGPVSITGAGAVGVSYPGFFDELDRIARAS